MLWMAIHFPQFCLDVHTRGAPVSEALVVVEGGEGRQRIRGLNRAAVDLGLYEDMGLNAAWILAPALRVLNRVPRMEQQALLDLADWVGQFSAQISVNEPSGLLLEAGGSLRLFGGLAGLRDRVRGGLEQLGYRAALSVAPAPTAAAWLAINGDGAQVLDRSGLRPALAGLPLALTGFPSAVLDALRGMGISRVGDIYGLPRKAFTRRLGRIVTGELDRALGQAPDPRRWHVPAAVFDRRLLLPAEESDRNALLFPLRRLLDELAGYLRTVQAGLRGLNLYLLCADGSTSSIPIGLLRCSRDTRQLFALLKQRLERISLPAPVEEVRLYADRFEALAPETADLFAAAGAGTHDWRPLVERMAARLGDDRVFGVQALDEHRPEHAWRTVSPSHPTPPGLDLGHRPIWLLPEPRRLATRDGRPWMQSGLQLLQGPERIESGWWDGRDVARDYYRARDGSGVQVWIFQERRAPHGWYLHGLFG